MGITSSLKKLTHLPGVLKARHLAEVAVTPHVRGELAEAQAQAVRTDHLIHDHAARVEATLYAHESSLRDLLATQPVVLNAISSTNGVARMSQRQIDQLRNELEGANRPKQIRVDLGWATERVDGLERWVHEHTGDSDRLMMQWRSDLAPHVESLHWVLQRVEMVRREMMHELRYGHSGAPRAVDAPFESKIVNHAAVDTPDLRLNLGSGHVALDGYANVDMRALPGVDVVARLDDLPVEAGSVAEIFSSHVLEHFPREELVRTLLPYWFATLRPGGTFRAVVPDLAAMSAGFAAGTIPFDVFREVVYGGQEYEGDTHFTGFTTAAMAELLTDAGFEHVEIVAEGRESGLCLEFEITAVKPSE